MLVLEETPAADACVLLNEDSLWIEVAPDDVIQAQVVLVVTTIKSTINDGTTI